jgi:acetamidase/formamidase
LPTAGIDGAGLAPQTIGSVTTHDLSPVRANLHGHFSAELAHVLEVDSGDMIRARTLRADWVDADFERQHPFDDGHALLGPVFVRGARPGDAMAIEILSLRPARSGRTAAGDFPSLVNDRLGLTGTGHHRIEWEIEPEKMVARALGFDVEVRPFLGVIGMPPAEPGIHSTIPPRLTGGNIDCRELVAGSALVIPVAVKGGLLSFGDGHAAQGDGEVGGTAIECAMDEVVLRVSLRAGAGLKTPEAHTPAGFITFGFSPDLDEAFMIALEAMIDRLQLELSLERVKATALASVCVDFRVTQVANETLGVHALLPIDRLRREGIPINIRN